MHRLIVALLLVVSPLLSLEFFHTVESVNYDGKEVVLSDGSTFSVGWWYTGVAKSWDKGSRLKISRHSYIFNPYQLENVETGDSSWGNMTLIPAKDKQVTIARMPSGVGDEHAWKKVVLTNGLIFKNDNYIPASWHFKDVILIFHYGDFYDLYNATAGNWVYGWKLIGNEKPSVGKKIQFEDILNLESRLNKRVVYQKHAVSSVFSQLLNYSAGVNNPVKPVGVFLFIGPTGVGKTELAKVLTDELFQSQDYLIRFDMSHFVEGHTIARLIGSPPGYGNHEQGGQLTEALKEKPQSVVLLDEMEKAHIAVQKAFLPIFDEGFIQDAKHITISCKDAIFIITTNLCSQQISEMFNQGYSEQEVLDAIEPTLMETLSPELYNRVEPVIFRPLNPAAMGKLVDLMIDEIRQRIAKDNELTLVIDDTARDYLIIHGYHPTLGARPLKKLIDKKLLAALSLALIKEELPRGSTLLISYDAEQDQWIVTNQSRSE